MDTVFMNSENSKTSKPYILILNLTDKIDLRTNGKSIAFSNRGICYTWKKHKKNHITYKFKISCSTWNDEFSYQMDHT